MTNTNNINFEKVLQKIGGSATDTTSYNSVKETWDSHLSVYPKCPPLRFFIDTWLEMIYSGQETGTWKQEREKAYVNEGIFIETNMDLIMEYNLAIVSNDLETAQKYKTLLEEIHSKRQAIKQANPKS